MKVLLVGPDYEENLSIRYLSSSLQAAGHDTTLAVFNSAEDIDAVAEQAESADLVGLSMCFQTRAEEFLRLARRIKSRDQEKVIVAGGHYASCAAEPLLQHHPELDIVVIHEGEQTLVEIAAALPEWRERVAEVRGIAYLDRREVRFTEARKTIEDLDALPFPDRRGRTHWIAGVPTSYLMGSRGCYGSCAYCCITTLHRMAPGKRFRQRDPERIADEMAVLYHERGTRQFVFHDDNFLVPSEALNHARLASLEKALQRRRVKDIALVIKCRPADASREVLLRLKEMGLVRVFMGIESSTEQGLATLERKQTMDESVRALELCAELDISAQFTMMIFNPDATVETLRSDVAFMRRFCGNPLNFCRTEIYAGTPLEQRMIALGRARGDYRARVYSLLDPVADRACNASIHLFCPRCWASDSLMQHAIGLDHVAAVLKRFHRGNEQEQVWTRIAAWLRSVNLDTIHLLEEVIELSSASLTGNALEYAMASLRERELATRQKLFAEGLKLRVAAEAWPFTTANRRARLARQAAAAVLAMGMPAAMPLQQAMAQEKAPAVEKSAPEKETAKIVGTVKDTAGNAIPFAVISLTNVETKSTQTFKTDRAGQYKISLKPGKYSVKANVFGSQSVAQAVVVKSGASKRVDLTLQTFDYGVAEMAAPPIGKEIPPEVLMPEPQSGTLKQVPQQPKAYDHAVAETAAHPLKTTASIVGTITDQSGAVIASADITVSAAGGGTPLKLKTDNSGHYEVHDLKPGKYTILVQAQGFKQLARTIELQSGEATKLDVILPVGPFCCEYAAAPMQEPRNPWRHKEKPFTYYVGDDADQGTFAGVAKLVYGHANLWVQIYEANRKTIPVPGDLTNGSPVIIPKVQRHAPKLLAEVKPEFPAKAKANHVSGDAVLDVALNDDGTVKDVSVIEGGPLLAEAAKAAVKQWRFEAPKTAEARTFVVVVTFTKQGSVKTIIG